MKYVNVRHLKVGVKRKLARIASVLAFFLDGCVGQKFALPFDKPVPFHMPLVTGFSRWEGLGKETILKSCHSIRSALLESGNVVPFNMLSSWITVPYFSRLH